MTKKFAQFAMLIVAAFAFTSCGKSHEDMINEYTEHLEAGAVILNDIADDKDVDENLDALKTWVSDGNDLDAEMKEYDEENKVPQAEADEIAEKFKDQVTKAATAYGLARAKATMGKHGAKVRDILKDMK
mgnify:CR=1 FL=1